MYQKKVFRLQSYKSEKVQLGYFTHELFWNLLLQRQLTRTCQAYAKQNLFY